MLLALLLTGFAIGGVAAGVFLGQTRGFPPRLAAAGAGLLIGISLFWMLPEMAQRAGWLPSVMALSLGTIALWSVDRYVHPICPSCSHTHDHQHCGEPPLHGFAAPLLIAAGIHSFLDGWSVALLSRSGPESVAMLGLALHKIPEGLALGLIARESLTSAARAFLACAAVESLTLAGAWTEPLADAMGALRFGPYWVAGVLALIGGSFLFLGFHAVHGSRHKPGVVAVFLATLAATGCFALVHWRVGPV